MLHTALMSVLYVEGDQMRTKFCALMNLEGAMISLISKIYICM